jgi:DNA-binding response OmpR family regulator
MMEHLRVLIVEDEWLIAASVEAALQDAGHVVTGIAASQAKAIQLAADERPDCAVVDISLGPGDGRVVARALSAQGVAILFATGQCEDIQGLSHTGALGCLPKPYSPGDVPPALLAISRHRRGDSDLDLPGNMFLLDAA